MNKKELLKLIKFIKKSSEITLHTVNDDKTITNANLDEVSFTINEAGEVTIHLRGKIKE